MHGKTTLALLTVTVAVGAYLSLYEIRQPPPEERAERAKRILNLSPETVTRIALELPQVQATLRRDGTTWRIDPGGGRADPNLAEQLVELATSLTAQRALAPSPERPLDEMQSYGLSPAIGRITLVAGETPVTLLIGETTPIRDNRYVRVADRPELFIVPSRLFDLANKPAEAFQDPRLIRVDQWGVDELAVRSPQVTYALKRQEEAWWLEQPLRDRADRTAVGTLLTRLGSLIIARVVEPAAPVERLAEWGLEAPQAEITLHQREGAQAVVSLFFGKPLPEDGALVYATRSDEPPLYAVNAADLLPLLQDPQGLRETSCFSFFLSEVMKVEWTREGSTWAVERTGEAWRVDGSGEILDAARIEALLNDAADLLIVDFAEDRPSDLAAYGLAPPSGALTLWIRDSEAPQRLLIGAVVPGSLDRYGRIEGRDPIMRLPARVTDLLNTTLDQLRPPDAPG